MTIEQIDKAFHLRQTALSFFLQDVTWGGVQGSLPHTEAQWKHLKEIEAYLASGSIPEEHPDVSGRRIQTKAA
jgi:hypothetical protein